MFISKRSLAVTTAHRRVLARSSQPAGALQHLRHLLMLREVADANRGLDEREDVSPVDLRREAPIALDSAHPQRIRILD